MTYPPIVDGVIRTVPHTGVMAALTALAVTNDYNLYGGYLAAYMISTEIMSHALKAILVRSLPKSVTTRPGDTGNGACGTKYNNLCTSCSVYSTPGSRSRTPGMYSGHAASVMFNLIFWTRYAHEKKFSKARFYSIFSLLLVLALLVIHNRVSVSKCHTALQAAVGAVVGSVMGFVSYLVLNKIDGEVFPLKSVIPVL